MGWMSRFAVVVASLAMGIIFSPETFRSEANGSGRGGLGKMVPGLAYLLCFATAWVAALWVTFISSTIMFRCEIAQARSVYEERNCSGSPEARMFGNLQSRMFPAYFAVVGACSAISLASFGHLHPWSSASTAEKHQFRFLTSSFALHLANLVVFTPLTIQLMKQKSRMEREENAGEEIGPSKKDHAKVSPELGAKKKEFGMVHGLSCAANIMSSGCLAMHSLYLAGKLNP